MRLKQSPPNPNSIAPFPPFDVKSTQQMKSTPRIGVTSTNPGRLPLPCKRHERSHIIVSKIRSNHHYVSIPANWNLPKFALAQRVQTSNPLSDTPDWQTGKILGIQYFNTDGFWVTHYAQRTGWHYPIHLDAGDPLVSFQPSHQH